MKVCVIGAGPAGLTAAYQLAKQGEEVAVYEASGHVGGMSRSIELWGQTVDLGPHRFFSSDARVNRLWLEIVGQNYAMVDRLTRIFYNRRFFHYPLQPFDALSNLGLANATACITSYLRERLLPTCTPDHTFESWVVGRFGRRLFETFFKSYSEKLWGISCRELDADFAAQRIKKLSLAEVIKNSLRIGGRRHRTLVDQFAYPLGGTGMVYQRMADYVEALGELHLTRPVRRVLHADRRVVGLELADGTQTACDHVISTMPLTLLVKGLGDVPADVTRAASSLTFRNTVLVYLHLAGNDLFPDQWLYIHDPDLRVGRITNFRNWVPQLYGNSANTVVALEYWSNDDGLIWGEADEQIVERAKREFRSTGLLGSAEILDGTVVRVPKCYPVYARGYQHHLQVVIDHLRKFQGLTPIGRYGAFKYNNQDHSILMGILAAERILAQQEHDLWAVNTDYDAYQEEATITASGLVTAEVG
jgi:protoporphyrinogen oxidase